MVQARTGHAHIGSYYDYFNIAEIMQCECGTFQTRNHIIRDCPANNEHRHIIRSPNGQVDLKHILGSQTGLSKLAAFIEATGAFEKAGNAP